MRFAFWRKGNDQSAIKRLKPGAAAPAALASDKPAPVAADDPVMKAGGAIYKDACAPCHRDNGQGDAGALPPPQAPLQPLQPSPPAQFGSAWGGAAMAERK